VSITCTDVVKLEEFQTGSSHKPKRICIEGKAGEMEQFRLNCMKNKNIKLFQLAYSWKPCESYKGHNGFGEQSLEERV
jgi:hypothetical protein